jgi:hypothetical protein
MPKLTARRLLHALNEAKRPAAPPLNMDKWRIQIRDIRNQLIKLRDKTEDEGERVDAALYDDEILTAKDTARLNTLQDRVEMAVDAIAEAINQLDTIL